MPFAATCIPGTPLPGVATKYVLSKRPAGSDRNAPLTSGILPYVLLVWGHAIGLTPSNPRDKMCFIVSGSIVDVSVLSVAQKTVVANVVFSWVYLTCREKRKKMPAVFGLAYFFEGAF